MKTKLTGGLSIALTLTMIGYMSLSLQSVNAQSGKASKPAKSEPAKSPTAPSGAGQASLAPTGSGVNSLQNVETPASSFVPAVEEVEGGCCGQAGE